MCEGQLSTAKESYAAQQGPPLKIGHLQSVSISLDSFTVSICKLCNISRSMKFGGSPRIDKSFYSFLAP